MLRSLAKKVKTEGFMLTLQETRSIYDSMNRSKIEFVAYVYIFLINI